MSTAIEQQLQDLVSVMGAGGKLQELNEKRKAERIEALTAELEQQLATLATAQTDLGNAQAKVVKSREAKERAVRKADECETQLRRAKGAKYRAGDKVDDATKRISELQSALAALGVDGDA